MSLDSYSVKEIRDICEINASSYSKKDNWNFFNYLDTKNIIKGEINEIKYLDPSIEKIPSRAKRKVNVDDIIISTVRPNQEHYGMIKYDVDNFLVSTGFTTLTVDKTKAMPEFIYFYITQNHITESLQTIAEQSTTSYPSIRPSDIGDIVINLPPLEIQKRISNILSNIENKIEINKKINRNLLAIADTIFNKEFRNFDEYSQDDLITSDFGLIPKNWCYKTLDEISDVAIGKTPPRKESRWFSEKEGVKWISIKDLGNSGTYIFETSEYLTEDAIEKFNMKLIPANTVILSFKLTVGRVGITTEDMVTNEAIAHFKLNNSPVTKEYLYLYLKNFNYETLGSTSSIAKAINSKIVKKIPILIPSKDKVNSISNTFESIFEQIKNNQRELTKLTKLRDTLLPKLMSGEIDVSEINCDIRKISMKNLDNKFTVSLQNNLIKVIS